MKVHGIFATTIILLGGCGLSPLELDAADLGVSSPAPKWRVQDWTATRVRGRMQEVSPSSILPGGEVGTPDMATGQEGPVREVDWLISTSAPVNAASAVSGMFTTSSATDSLYFAINGAGGGTVGINNATHVNNHISALTTANVFKLVNLYATHPSVVWYASIPAVNGNGIALSIDGSKVYVLDSGGTLRCYQAGATTAPATPTVAATCAGWTNYSAGTAVQGSSPWVDYATDRVFFGDDLGRLHKVNAVTGAGVWVLTLAVAGADQKPVRVGAVVIGGAIYVGDDGGWIYRIRDSATTPNNASSNVASYVSCLASPCAAQWAVRGAVSVDILANRVYASASGRVFEFPADLNGNWEPTAITKTLDTTSNAIDRSGPSLDVSRGWVYIGYANRFYKVQYPFTGGATSNIYSVAMHAAGVDSSYPRTLALPFGTSIYIGDGAGITERYGCATSTAAPVLTGTTGASYGNTINTAMVVDYTSGNVNFGYTDSSGTGGGLVQFPMGAGFTCPTGTQSCSGAACGSTGCAQCCVDAHCSGGAKCINGSCVTGCPTVACSTNHITPTCSMATGICSGTCDAGWASCDSNLNSNGCETGTTTDVNNCGGCAMTCSTNHIATPVCSGSNCTGSCDFGYSDCNSNKRTDGCESTNTCTNCCGNTCAAGRACIEGACVVPSMSQANAMYVCGTGSEHHPVTVTCPTGQKIAAIQFAQYGTPGGTCGSFSVGSCALDISAHSTLTSCIGQGSCTVTGENATYGDPCSGTFKRLSLQVRCGPC